MLLDIEWSGVEVLEESLSGNYKSHKLSRNVGQHDEENSTDYQRLRLEVVNLAEHAGEDSNTDSEEEGSEGPGGCTGVVCRREDVTDDTLGGLHIRDNMVFLVFRELDGTGLFLKPVNLLDYILRHIGTGMDVHRCLLRILVIVESSKGLLYLLTVDGDGHGGVGRVGRRARRGKAVS